MARTKGSVNRPKMSNKGGLFNIKMEKQVAGSAICNNSGLGYIKWGSDNLMPYHLLELYNNSVTHRAAINFTVQSIVGNGVDTDKMQLEGVQLMPNNKETFDELLRKVALDYALYGSYAIQIIMNKDGKTFSFYHMPLENVRWGEYDEEGHVTEYWISNDWSAMGTNPPYSMPSFQFRDDFKVERGQTYLYVYSTYSPAMKYYTQPHYQGGIKAIQAECEYINFDLRTTVNNFVPSGMLVLDDVETEEERRSIIDNITSMFTGSKNSNSVMLTFRSNVEQKSPEFIPFQANQGNVNLYADSNERTISRILAAHQIPSASLIGLPDIGNSGFSSEADKLEASYQLYQRLTGNYNRMAVIKTLNQMFSMNGINAEIIMKPLSFNDFGDDADVEERTTE